MRGTIDYRITEKVGVHFETHEVVEDRLMLKFPFDYKRIILEMEMQHPSRPFVYEENGRKIKIEYVGDLCLQCEEMKEETYGEYNLCDRCHENEKTNEENRAYDFENHK